MTNLDAVGDSDVWPDPAYLPPPELRAEIRRVAATVSDEEVRETGWTFTPWYSKFVIAEARVKARKAGAAEYKKAQREKAATAASTKVAASYPSAEAWSKYPKHRSLNTGDEAFEKFYEGWHKSKAASKLPVFRPTIAANAAMTINDGRALFRTLLCAIDDMSGIDTFIWRERVQELEERIKELEKRPQLRFLGPWDDAASYETDDLVYLGGSVWICLGVATERPSTHSTTWQLFVRSGRDGRDVKSVKGQQS